MQYIDKKTENGIIRFTYDDFSYGFRQIEYAFKDKNNEFSRFLNFTKDSDIKICGMNLEEEDTDNISFAISEDDILYPLFIKFMGNDDFIKIESDDEKKYNLKYTKFEKLNNAMNITIVNKKENISCVDKFNCFIKGRHFDLRSKIDKDNLDYKKRLLNLFDDIEILFIQNDERIVKEYKIN